MFYIDILGLIPEVKNPHALSIRAGESILEFKKSDRADHYHFAFNVSFDDLETTLEELKDSGINPISFSGSEIIEFPNWKARSIYFYDPAGNIVEYIGRQEVNPPFAKKPFSISEVGLALDEIAPVVAKIQTTIPIKKYDGNGLSFAALGDPEGLIILSGTNRNWYPTDRPALRSTLEAIIEIEGESFSINQKENKVDLERS